MNEVPVNAARVGYLCASPASPIRDIYRADLVAAGCIRVYEDTPGPERPEFDRALNWLRSGDELLVWRVNQLPSAWDQRYSGLLNDLKARSVVLVSLLDGLSTVRPNGDLCVNLAWAQADQERAVFERLIQAGHSAEHAVQLLMGHLYASESDSEPSTPDSIERIAAVRAGTMKVGVDG
ncbi:recombinase family protein [Nonomuraea sp. NPDC050383]|uniref:recombinase family protein n=1 Tax=Nonomuraea sp. NPDC050383 TaxID=3364362 RepID=UPI0037888D90